MDSVTFDRAADFYDRTRSLPPETMAQVVDLLTGELANRGVCLEIGVGTGRIARPLTEAGFEIVGIDLSAPMLKQLAATPPGGRIPIALADATRLPFADASMGAVLACHVLHLIPRWEEAVAEALRVLGPDGVFLVDLGNWSKGEWRELTRSFSDASGIPREHPGANGPEEVDALLARQGSSVRVLPEIAHTRRLTYRHVVESLEKGIWSFTWRADPVRRTKGADHLRSVLAARGKQLDDHLEWQQMIQWRAYEL